MNGIDFSVAIDRARALAEGFIAALPNLAIALAVFVLFVLTARWVGSLVRGLAERRKRARNLGIVMGRLVQWVIVLVGLLVALAILLPTFRPGDIVSVLGLGSVAIGFAFRDILQNFLAGILILLTEPFRIGDQIVVGSYEGTVEEIQTRATHIRTYDGRRVVIPNSKLFTESVIVNTAFEQRRLEYDIGIGFGDDIDLARKLILETLRETKDALDDPAPEAFVVDLAESSVNIRARWWISPPRQADTFAARDHVLSSIKNKLVAAGIDLPFPTSQVLFHDQTEETDGNRARQREGWPSGKDGAPKPRGIAAALQELTEARQDATGRDQPS